MPPGIAEHGPVGCRSVAFGEARQGAAAQSNESLGDAIMDLFSESEHDALGIPERIVRSGCRHPQTFRDRDGNERCCACKAVIEKPVKNYTPSYGHKIRRKKGDVKVGADD